MAECWEAFSMSKNIVELSTDSNFQSYRNELIKESEATLATVVSSSLHNDGAIMTRNVKRGTPKSSRLPMVTPPSKRLHHAHHMDDNDDDAVMNHDDDDDAATPGVIMSAVEAVAALQEATTPAGAGAATTSTPSPTRSHSTTTTTPTSNLPPRYDKRSNVGQVVLLLDPSHRPAVTTATTTTSTSESFQACVVQYQHFDTNAMKPYRHMFTPLVDRAKALEQHLVELGHVIQDQYKLEYAHDDDDDVELTKEADAAVAAPVGSAAAVGFAKLAPIGVPRQDKVTCIGRICNEVCAVAPLHECDWRTRLLVLSLAYVLLVLT